MLKGDIAAKFEAANDEFVFTTHWKSGEVISGPSLPFDRFRPMLDFVVGSKTRDALGFGEEYISRRFDRRYAVRDGKLEFKGGEEWLEDEEGTPLMDIGDHFHRTLAEMRALNPALSGVYCSGPVLLSREIKSFEETKE